MLSDNDVKEHLGLVYVYAVATMARCSFEPPRVDRDSVDVKLMYRNDHWAADDDIVLSPELALQVKTTTLAGVDVGEEEIGFSLKVKNQHDLVKKTLVPRILVVVILPDEETNWMGLTTEQLVMKHCGYWVSLHGQAKTPNVASQVVKIPRAQIFNPQNLSDLMGKISRQEQLP